MALSAFIADRLGLHFPRERVPDLQRGLAGAAEEFGFADPAACAAWLMTTPLTRGQLQVLAGHLTVGETYFFREPKTFEVLAHHVLPQLIRERRGRQQRLRLWSAGCASGEEPYSLAILLHQVLPDLADWHVTILATDINARFLRKAVAGVYGEWSFRGAPRGFTERYFDRTSDGRHAIRPELQKLVTFEHVNLVEDVYPSLATDTNAMDLIFCRNVLMYFAPAQIRKVAGNLRRALIDGGWLVVSPGETSQVYFGEFATRSFPGVILYRKSPPPASLPVSQPPAIEAPAPTAPAAPMRLRQPEPRPTLLETATSLYEEGRYAEAVERLLPSVAGRTPGREVLFLLVRALANQGRLTDALAWCDRWTAAHKLDAAACYLRAVVLMEDGRTDEARQALRSAVYLEPGLVLAHVALGSLARSAGRHAEARRHFANALHILRRLQPADVLPESDGLTAGRLADTIAALTAFEPHGGGRQPQDHRA